MHKSIATVSVSGALDEKLIAIAAAKFDGIELFDNDLVASPMPPEEVRGRCDDLGLSIDLFQPVRDVDGVAPERFPEALRRVRRKLDVMERLGVTTLLACSNATTSALGDADLSAEQLSNVGDLAADHGFTVAFEALAWGTHTNRLAEAWDIVERADHPAVGLAVDTFHLLARGDDAAALTGIPGDRIAFLQVADAPVLGMDVLQWSRHHRVFPGQGAFDLAPVVAAVVEAGYRGPLSLEVFSDVVREADPHLTSLDAMRSLLHLEEAAAVVGRPGWCTWRWRGDSPSGRAFDPPPAPAPVDLAFVEVASRGPDMDGLLEAMGFRPAGRHRSKPVTWWRNGSAHVLLNGASDLEDRWATATSRPSVTGVGLVVDDVPAFAARRSALLWPGLPLRHGSGEAVLAGVDSPAGIHTFVAGRPGAAQDWQGDFVPVGPAAGAGVADDGDGWLGIDHVGYAVPFGLSEAEISFHRTLFAMLPGAVSEFTDPRGRMRSRVMRPPGGDLRVVLNITEGGPSGPARLGLNQVAFACPDVLAAAAAMREAGVGLLEVPDNYYDDLAARFDLPAARLAQLRALGVMYDRDDTGELLHVYTRRIAGTFYVEVLQRIGGYDGYGAGNTTVRLAAMAAQVADGRPAASVNSPPPNAPIRPGLS